MKHRSRDWDVRPISLRALLLPKGLSFLLPKEEHCVADLFDAHRRARERERTGEIDRAAIVGAFGTDDPEAISPQVPTVEKAVNEAASRVRATWLTYILFWTYLVISTGSVTHLQMFLDEGVKLPVLDVDLPLTGFFFVAPTLFVVMHAYLLVQLWELRERADGWRHLTRHLMRSDGGYHQMRQMLDPYVVLQAITLPAQSRKDRRYRNILAAIVWLTLVAAPVSLLVFMQIRFLPYQSEPITWAHRGLLAVDLTLLLMLWAGGRSGKRSGRPGGKIAAWGSSLALVGLSVFCLVFPGEWADRTGPRWAVRQALVGDWDQTTFRHGAEEPGRLDDPLKWWQAGLFSNRIMLTVDDRVVDRDELWKLEHRENGKPREGVALEPVRSFRNRIFRSSHLAQIDMRRVSFEAAQLQGASLFGARLQGASLIGAQLQGASLLGAQLQGTSLDGAQLQGASLFGVRLQGASLIGAQLQGASLLGAQLQGTSLLGAQLQGASLFGVRLQGASLDGAQLQGASLDGARLQGTSLDRAQLQGTSLDGAQLQGTSLDGAQLQGASLANAYLWRTVPLEERGVAFRLAKSAVAPVTLSDSFSEETVVLDGPAVTKLIGQWTAGIPDGERKVDAQKRLSILSPNALTPDRDERIVAYWTAAEANAPSDFAWAAMNAEAIIAAACRANGPTNYFGAPHAANGIATNGVLDGLLSIDAKRARSAALVLLGRDLGKPCPGAEGISDKAKARLEDILAHADATLSKSTATQ
ncbi:pentapeptide repeat-containing protein [Jiella endophytica]|uniref:pentapeptide repeat-containing protein n=1 Tax=Jiella endophytica TaxID=2558362 RepID=UPI00142F561F|nr:pentapeptide repeat-containing protein [Jiella endophytica]